MEKNNDVARATVLRKSNNWDSPAEVLRKEHRLMALKGRERKKRTYTKVNEEFWSKGKGDLTKRVKNRCISSQKVDTEKDTGNNQTADRQERSKRKNKSGNQSKKKRSKK